jgi:tetratricopeptide (TPR) repeat protein
VIRRFSLIVSSIVLFALPAIPLAAQATPANGALKQAKASLLREDFSAAEATLRAQLKLHPTDAETMSLLGMALDGQKKLTEADTLHKRAVAAAPRSATILARYAQHMLTAGDGKGAFETFQKALALDPKDRFANLQLAQWAVRQKDSKAALGYLDRIPASEQAAPDVAVQRLVALDSIPGNQQEAGALFTRLSRETENDATVGSSIGWTLAQAGQYDQAETFLTHAHAADPADFHVLYDLGVVALYAGHNERAREVLETAVREQPNNVDVLYSLAFVESALKQPEAAIRWLAQAGQLAPQRADVQRLLAVTANELGAWEDAATAWDHYSKLAPNDDEARRERGYAIVHQGKFDAGVTDLEWYLARHPNDAMGYFELGVAQSASDPTKGIASLDKALALKADFPAARAVRGSLYYKQGKPEVALPDLEAVASETHDAAVLDRLGQTYLALDRLQDAVRVLRKAATMPGEPTVLLHLANALAQAGETAESDALLERYKQARPSQGPVDLMHFLSLTPEQQRADYQARVEKAIKDNPGDAVAQSHYLKLLLEENQMDQAAATARLILNLKPGVAVLADDGRALLEARQYVPAEELLAASGVDVDLAIATFHALGGTAVAATAGLKELGRAPETSRDANYYMAQAQMLNASGKPSDALQALDKGISADPARADLYWQSAVILAKNQRTPEALRLLDQAAKTLPREAAIPLTKAAVLEISGKTDEALHTLDSVQLTWPEVAGVWVARGIILAAHQHFDEARKALETAATHGARSPEAWSCLADVILRSAADPKGADAAEAAVSQALRLAPQDASVQDLAARIALKRGDSATAAARQQEARRQQPALASSAAMRLFENRPPRDW